MSPNSEPNRGQVYTIRRAVKTPELAGEWDSPAWKQADVAEVRHFHAKSSDHRPKTQAKLLYDANGVYVLFRVKDRYVLSTHTGYQSSVCRDACAEFFVRLVAGKGYFNFEMNCGGHLLLYYIEDPTRVGDSFKKRTEVSREWADTIRIYHSLPEVVSPERTEDTVWSVEYMVPFALFEAYTGPLGVLGTQPWRGNLYKCADLCSHPHWAAWAPIGDELNFHMPEYFGTFLIEA